MINSFSILFGLMFVGLVVVRAAMLDRQLPWFKAPAPAPPPAPPPTLPSGPALRGRRSGGRF